MTPYRKTRLTPVRVTKTVARLATHRSAHSTHTVPEEMTLFTDHTHARESWGPPNDFNPPDTQI